jgi:small-conductance mechanosensitive channel
MDVNVAISGIEQAADNLVAGLNARFSALLEVPAEFERLQASLAAASTSPLLLFFEAILVAALTAGTCLLLTHQAKKGNAAARRAWQRIFFIAAAVVAALVVGLTAAWLLAPSGLVLRTLRLWAVVTVVGCIVLFLVRALLMASRRPQFRERSYHIRVLAFTRDLSIAIGWALVGVAVGATLQLWGSGPGLQDVIRTGLGIPIYALFAGVVWRHRRTMTRAVAGPHPRSRWRSRLARLWPAIVIAFVVITFLSIQTALTIGEALPASAVLLTALIFLATPHLDAIIGNWAQRGLESSEISIPVAAGRQTARFALSIVTIALLGAMWATPLVLALGFEWRGVARGTFGMVLIALVAAFLWNVVGTMTGRTLQIKRATLSDDHDEPSAPRSRLGTLVPLLSAVGKSSILALATLSILVSVGVNVWPLITGLSVFGLAIGFGSQTLVKDVVSGLFFLIDDAFRFGEYIETSGAKGTVEKISIRSVSLRSSRGSIATVPYGQIGKIQNFSRDWVIEKLTFRVAFDTDVELVRRLFKKIGQDIAADPELAPDLIEPFKSQGIGEVEDGTLIIKAKFTAKPGKQSMIRRAALMAVQNAFRENGIHAVPKPLTANAEPTEAG